MKKFLLLFVMGMGIMFYTNAQVIELIGEGVMDVSSPVLIIPDPGTVDHVVVEAAGVFRMLAPWNDPAPADVSFSDSDESYPASFIEASPRIPDLTATQKWGYYTATFNTVDAGGITLINTGQEAYIVSLVAYVYRTNGDGVYSEAKGDHAFLFKNGSDNPVVYNFTIPWSNVPRDVVISIPFSDVNEDGRYSIIDVTAGALPTVHVEFDDNNEGDRLHIETITVPNVPGDVTDVSVSLYSPNPGNGIDTQTGDSFILSLVLLTTTYDQGCTLTYGYWKTHSIYGPASKPDPTWACVGGPDATFFLSGQSYIEVLNTKPKGNAYYILAHQYIAAELNGCADAYMGDVQTEFDAAAALFASYTPAQINGLKGDDPLRKQFVDLGEILDDFNMGEIGPGHCGEEYETMEKSALIDSDDIGELAVYPNPVSGNATVSFTPVSDGTATVDLYNSMGQKVSNLLSKNVTKGASESFTLDGGQFNEGLYIIVLKNGATSVSAKVSIK